MLSLIGLMQVVHFYHLAAGGYFPPCVHRLKHRLDGLCTRRVARGSGFLAEFRRSTHAGVLGCIYLLHGLGAHTL